MAGSSSFWGSPEVATERETVAGSEKEGSCYSSREISGRNIASVIFGTFPPFQISSGFGLLSNGPAVVNSGNRVWDRLGSSQEAQGANRRGAAGRSGPEPNGSNFQASMLLWVILLTLILMCICQICSNPFTCSSIIKLVDLVGDGTGDHTGDPAGSRRPAYCRQKTPSTTEITSLGLFGLQKRGFRPK